MDPIQVRSFHAILYCRNWDACVAFYTGVLGFGVADSRNGFVEVQVNPASRIGLIRRPPESCPEDPAAAVVLTFLVEDLDGARAAVASRWGRVSTVRRHPWGARLFDLKDPDGRRLEVWTG